jgi:uncharacterized protein with von Willebrand factor type A (vWA) domain
MPKRKNPPPPRPGEDLNSAVLDFLRRGQRAQKAVDDILREQPERRRTKPPTGRA